MSKNNILACALFFLFISSAFTQTKEIKKLKLENYLELETVRSATISPAGDKIIYSKRWINKYEDSNVSDIWIMDADGSNNRFFMKGGSPVWSPDGKSFAFVKSGEPKGSQIFVKHIDVTGPPTQITRLDKSPSSIKWSPDGKYISFTMLVPEKKRWPVKMPKKPDGANWTPEPKIIEDLVYRRDRSGFIENGYTHIFMVDASGGSARQITNGDWNHGRGGYSWTKDGKEILFSSLLIPKAEYAYRESEIYSINVKSGKVKQLTTRKGPDSGPVVSPDNKLVIYQGYDWTDDTFINSRVYLMNLDGSDSKLISGKYDESFSILKWADDNSGVYVNIREEGTGNFYFLSTKGKLRPLTEGQHMLSISAISDNGTAVGTISDPYLPGDIISFSLKDPKVKILTNVNDDILSDLTLGNLEEIWYKSTDGLDIQGWIITPPDFDPAKKYPLILSIHGGPHGMYGVGFNFRWQLHAAEGYVVIYTNPRGSSGYGSAFGNEIKFDYPNKDYDDLMNGVDEVMKKGYIDENNLFVYGGSGGGVLTSWIVGHTDRFAAASVNYPVINWISFVGTTDGASWYRNFAKYPWDDPSEHLRRSPLMYVGNVKTPTMLMTGVKDLRTPISQTEEFYEALKVLEVPTAMIRFNDEFHGTSSNPSNYMRTIVYLHYWFNKYKK